MPTLHWFHSLGIQGADASYVLTPRLAARFEAAGCLLTAPPEAGLPDDAPSSRAVTAQSPTPALLHLLGELAPDWALWLHTVETPDLRKPSRSGPIPLERLERELPDRHGAAGRRRLNVPHRGPAGAARIVAWMLETGLQPGDAVFFEAAGGLRPIQMGLTLGAELLRLVHPEVRVIGTSYAEFGILGRPEGMVEWASDGDGPEDGNRRRLSPIYDLSDLLTLPAWAAAGGDLRDRLDGARLAALQRTREPGATAEAAALQAFCANVHLGWPDDAIEPLRELIGHLDPPEGEATTRPERALVRRILRDQLHPLGEALPHAGAPERSMDRIRFHLKVADALVHAGRYGDAVRLLREILVSRMALAQAAAADRDVRTVRAAAELALLRAKVPRVRVLWKELGSLRNAASHGNFTTEERKSSVSAMEAAFSVSFDPLHHRVRSVCEDSASFPERADPVPTGARVVWLGPDGETPPERESMLAWNAYLVGFDAGAVTRAPQAAGKKLARRMPPPVVSILPAPPDKSSVPSGNWVSDKFAGPKAGPIGAAFAQGAVEHVVVFGGGAPTVLVLLGAWLSHRGALLWTWTPPSDGHRDPRGRLHPCFDRDTAARVLKAAP